MSADLKINKITENDNFAQYEILPFKRGFGHTFATPLRRMLLSSIQGATVARIKIKGVDHEFSSLDGLKEDVLRFVLNLQKVGFRISGSEAEKGTLKVKGPSKILAEDIKLPSNVVVVNPEFELGELADTSTLEVELDIESGYGLVLANDEERNINPGTIPLNKAFSPVLKVAVRVEATRVAQNTDYEKIVLEIETNGVVTPDEALKQAVKVLQEEIQGINEVVESI